MNTPLKFAKFRFDGRSIALAVTLATMVSIAPQEASARGGVFHLLSTWSPVSRAEAGTGTHVARPESHTEVLGGCGGKRFRDPNTHQCRGPADLGH
jgi:hypothetical protein